MDAEGGTLRTGEDAFRHLCRVVSGLESPILGEPEIFAQFRAAVAARVSSGAEIDRILSAAVGVGRAVRRVMGDRPNGSLARVAARLAAPHGSVAVLGTGLMAKAAVQHLTGVDIKVIGRRPGELAGRPIQPWDNAAEALRTFPAVISAIPGKTYVWSKAEIAQLAAARGQPLLLIDLGMPAGFEQPVSGVDYIGVDDLAALAPPQEIPAPVEVALQTAVNAAWRRLSPPVRARKVIAEIVELADAVVEEEIARFGRRLDRAGDPERVLRQLAHSVARRIVHEPISFLGASDDPRHVELVAEAFGLDDE